MAIKGRAHSRSVVSVEVLDGAVSHAWSDVAGGVRTRPLVHQPRSDRADVRRWLGCGGREVGILVMADLFAMPVVDIVVKQFSGSNCAMSPELLSATLSLIHI